MKVEEARKLVARSQGAQPESAILDQVRQYLRMRGWYVVRMQQGIGCHKGIADLWCIRDGRAVWVEVKTAKGKQSEHQVRFEREVTEHGGEYVVVRSLEEAMGL